MVLKLARCTRKHAHTGSEDHGVDTTTIHLALHFNATDCTKLFMDKGAESKIFGEIHSGNALKWTEFSGAQYAVELLIDWNM